MDECKPLVLGGGGLGGGGLGGGDGAGVVVGGGGGGSGILRNELNRILESTSTRWETVQKDIDEWHAAQAGLRRVISYPISISISILSSPISLAHIPYWSPISISHWYGSPISYRIISLW